jgi:type IX secretion system PorP/SprF family membrane protein
LLLISQSAQSQDIHYTQFQNAPYIISPALTGVFSEDVRFMANYRRQWFNVPQVNFETFSVAADLKIRPDRLFTDGYFALGLSVNRDQAGTARLTLLSLGLNGSYTRRLSNRALLSVGMQGSFNQRRFDISDLSFNEQYVLGGGGYDPGLPTGESRFNGTNAFLSLSAGFNLRLQKLSKRVLFNDQINRNKVDIGFGLYHLNRPDQSFADDPPVRLPVRITAYVFSTLQVRDSDFDLVVNALSQVQQNYFELLGLFGLKYHLSRQIGAKKALQFTAAVRFGDQPQNYLDAIAPVIEFFLEDWQFGVSYDVNLSPFKLSTNGNSGIEFFLRHSLSRVKLLNPRPHIRL